MDINSAELQVKRLLGYVKDISESSHTMYGKSKARLKEVAATCSEVVRIIYTILEDETLSNMDEVEFSQSSNPDIAAVLDGMQAELNRLKSFVSTSSVSSAVSTSNTASVSRKQALVEYAKVFETLVTKHISLRSAQKCAELLDYWFKTRFLTKSCSNFHYNMKRVPGWIRDIVIVYGYNVNVDTEDQFIQKFEEWCRSIETDTSNVYAVPYFIYSFNRYPDASQLTLTAAVLWDVLLDNGLSQLCSLSDNEMYPTEDCVYRLCGQYNPGVLDAYEDYKMNSELLKKCKLIKD